MLGNVLRISERYVRVERIDNIFENIFDKNFFLETIKKEAVEVLKCDKCDLKCNSMNTFRKHTNTRPSSSNEINKKNTIEKD